MTGRINHSQIPSAYLSVYSASKAYLRSWSQSVGQEVAMRGVHVEHVNAYFVTTAMSKIRRYDGIVSYWF
jgi:17beta-estradiol 17-dehydrogenase / very-long-chain 3-oxoacyl-CoA reductase